MVTTVLRYAAVLIFLATSYIQVQAQKDHKNPIPAAKTEIKFIENIEISAGSPVTETAEKGKEAKTTTSGPVFVNKKPNAENTAAAEMSIESASVLQFKYALLLNTEVESIRNMNMFQLLDEWMGTRYRMGGNGKTGIDCSAFMQVMYTGLFGLAIPRTAREQFNATRRISRTELKEGDLVFFNTRGGVSHVGIYLQNNKFAHASSSEGVTISDLYDSYWSRRFIGVGRYEGVNDTRLFFSKL